MISYAEKNKIEQEKMMVLYLRQNFIRIKNLFYKYKSHIANTSASACFFSSFFYEFHVLPNFLRYLIFIAFVPLFFSLKIIPSFNTFTKKFLFFFVNIFLFGLITELIAFSWVFESIKNFFSTSTLTTAIFYFCCCVLSSFYYILLFSPLFFVLSHQKKDKISLPLIIMLSVAIILFENILPRLSPWHFGYSLFFEKDLSQIASFLGPMGVSFLVFFVNLYICFYVHKIVSIIPLVLTILSIKFSLHYREKDIKKDGFLEYKIGFIQPNFSPAIMNESKLNFNKNFVLEYLKTFKNKSLEFVVLPESSVYYIFGKSPEDKSDIQELARQSSVAIATQYLDVLDNRFSKVLIQENGDAFVIKSAYSKAVIIKPSGEYTNEYIKWRPMPFGEILPYFNKFNTISDYFFYLTSQRLKILKGTEATPIEFKNTKIGFFICYDAIEQNLQNLLARNGSKFFVNLSNFYWMSDSNASFVFSIINQFKAIETQRSILYLTNNGPTILFDLFGHKLFDNKKIFDTDAAVLEIPYQKEDSESFYGRNFEKINKIFEILGIIFYIFFMLV